MGGDAVCGAFSDGGESFADWDYHCGDDGDGDGDGGGGGGRSGLPRPFLVRGLVMLGGPRLLVRHLHC